jgi:hypothetical protein
MFDNMHRLHARGPTNPGICVDRDGAMLGPDCVLVGRTPRGFRGIGREAASALQKCAGIERDDDWLFRQCEYIADSLNKGQIALAQIYGLRIPVGSVDDRLLKDLAAERFTKWSFNPDEPRLPKGDQHGGEWTTGADGGAAALLTSSPPTSADSDTNGGGGDGISPILQLDAVASDDASTATDADGGSGVPSGGSSMRYEWVPSQGGNSDEGSPATLPSPDIDSHLPPPGAGFAGNQADWLFGDLAPATEGALARLMTGMTGASIVFGILFIPTNRSIVGEGPIAGSPGLSYRYDSDMGTLQLRQDIGSLGPVVFDEAQKGTDGLYRDAEGNIVGRYLSGSGFIIDVGALPGYRMVSGSNAAPNGQPQQQNQPQLCPDDNKEDITGRSERAIAYQQQITKLRRGLEVTLNGVRFDGCREEDGTMLEAKGPGFADKMDGPDDWKGWFTGIAGLEDQMMRQNDAAAGRTVEWHFAEQPVADFFRKFAKENGLTNVVVIYTPPRRP